MIVYHGTSRENAEKIQTWGFESSQATTMSGSISNYGDGVYFFRNKVLAFEHARREFGDSAVVLEAMLSLDTFARTAIARSDLNNNGSDYFHRLLGNIIDADVDRGIIVVRPSALHAICITSLLAHDC